MRSQDKIWRVVLGIPAIFPLLFMLPAVVLGQSSVIASSVADVLGTGAEICLFITLAISSWCVITGSRWALPLRQWYGIMMAVIAITDAILAAATTVEFGPNPLYRLAGHSFLVTGLLMVMIVIPLVATSSRYGMRTLGKYWPRYQKLTYVIWALLGLHLMLLFNFGPDSGDQLTGQRLYQYIGCSLILVILRIPAVKRLARQMKKQGTSWVLYLLSVPWVVLFVLSLALMINEEVFKGVAAITGNPIPD